jgi:hypothetical protein
MCWAEMRGETRGCETPLWLLVLAISAGATQVERGEERALHVGSAALSKAINATSPATKAAAVELGAVFPAPTV